MIKYILPLRKILASLIILLGGGVFAFAFAADALGIGNNPGLGPRQVVLTWAGCVFVAIGIYLFSRPGRKLFHGIVSFSIGSEESASVFLVAAWFGLITGLIVVFILADRKFSGEYIGLSLHFAWMASVTTLVTFLIPGAFLFVIARLRKGFNYLRTGVMIFSSLSFLSVFVMFPKLHVYAALLLSAGLGFQTTRIVVKNPPRFYWLVRNTFPGFAFIAFSLAIWMVVLDP